MPDVVSVNERLAAQQAFAGALVLAFSDRPLGSYVVLSLSLFLSLTKACMNCTDSDKMAGMGYTCLLYICWLVFAVLHKFCI